MIAKFKAGLQYSSVGGEGFTWRYGVVGHRDEYPRGGVHHLAIPHGILSYAYLCPSVTVQAFIVEYGRFAAICRQFAGHSGLT